MDRRPEVLAVIPARGGSRAVPHKNIITVGHRPLIAWSIEAALSAHAIDRVVVSTDCADIADISRQYGADAPFLRPPELALDDTPGIAPIVHAVRWLEDYQHYRPHLVMCLQPTSPLRLASDIDAAVSLALQKNADAVVSLMPVPHHPYWMKHIDPTGHLHDFMALHAPVTRRQDLPPVYTLNGAIYLAQRHVLLQRQSWYGDNTYAYVMPPERSLDIDTSWDLYLADLILQEHSHTASKTRWQSMVRSE